MKYYPAQTLEIPEVSEMRKLVRNDKERSWSDLVHVDENFKLHFPLALDSDLNAKS